jgi:hypothetical protein
MIAALRVGRRFRGGRRASQDFLDDTGKAAALQWVSAPDSGLGSNSRSAVVVSFGFAMGRAMILGMSLSVFTAVHVFISLIAIVSGVIVMFGLLGSNRRPGLTATFLLFTILTSASGFLFPFEKLLPSHMIGIISLLLLAVACMALYVMKLSGAGRWIYVLTAMFALYLNVFVLVIQSFLKLGPLHALAPSVPPSEPPFAIVQGIVLVFFIIVIIGAVRRFRPAAAYV